MATTLRASHLDYANSILCGTSTDLTIKCAQGEHRLARCHFATMILKLEGSLDILKMYLHAENEAASLMHSKLSA